jgi:hypothetical protein
VSAIESFNLERVALLDETPPIARIDFDIPLKGERTYLQSADILHALIGRLGVAGPLRLEFRQMIHHPIFVDADDADNPCRAGRFSFEDDGAWRAYGIFFDPSRSIAARSPNNEAEILAASTIASEADTASAVIGAPANFIETIVALNKVLVARYSKGKKAIFSAIKLDAVPDAGTVGVTLVKRMGSKIFVSDVLWNGTKRGELTFMAV